MLTKLLAISIVLIVLLKNMCCFLINLAPFSLLSIIVSIFEGLIDVYAVSHEEKMALNVKSKIKIIE
ncbi:hypothetical protein oki361_15880 [Helicobacter pylori]